MDYTLNHQTAQFRFDCRYGAVVVVTKRHTHQIIAFGQLHRKIKWLVTGTEILSQRIGTCSIKAPDGRARLKSITGLRAVHIFTKNLFVTGSGFTRSKVKLVTLRRVGLSSSDKTKQKEYAQITQIIFLKC
jgi:hypothetical protein